jgi:site-specific DNA recombinase
MSTYLVYVRQSYRRDSDADVSEEAQEAAARRLLPPGVAVEVIRDTGGHQSGATANRDGYRLLLRRIKDPDVAGVAVYDLSRLARNARLMLELKAELDRLNLHLLLSNLPDSKFDTAVGRFLFGQLCLAAQFQRDLDAERMVGLTRTKHDAGGHNGRDPFGYRTARDEHGMISRPHRLEVDPSEAEAVRAVFDRYASDEVGSMGELAGRLNAEGLTRRGRHWTTESVKDLVRRTPLYRGMAVYHRGADVRPGTHEPIITADQAQLVERVRLRRYHPGRYGRTGRVYPLSSLLWCSCGLRMRAETRSSRGRDWTYYVCPGFRDRSCEQKAVRAERVDAFVIGHLASHRTPDELVVAMRQELRTLRHLPTEGLRGERTRLETGLKRLGERYQWQEIEEVDYHRERIQLRKRLAELPAPVDENVIAFDRAASLLRPMGEIIEKADPERQRAILRHVLERVEIAAGEVAGITVRLEARPFFEDWPAAVVVVPLEGIEPPTQALGRPRSIR